MRFCNKGARQQAEYFNELQKIALTHTRLKIPLLEDEEGTHGAMLPGGTIFPEGLAIGSSFDLDLVRSVYAAAAAEARALGIHMLSARHGGGSGPENGPQRGSVHGRSWSTSARRLPIKVE